MLFVDGSGRRVAVSYEGSASAAPLLHIEYTTAQTASPTQTAAPTNTPTATQQLPTATSLPSVTPTSLPTATQPPATPTNSPKPSSSSVDVRIATGADDVEQRLSDGFMYHDSSDLELVNDPGVAKGDQSIGMRFANLNIPQGVAITRAYLTFHVDETSSEATSLTLRGQAADNAPGFSFNAYDVTSRPHTNASVNWSNLPAWTSVGASVQSPDIAPVIQEIVSRNGWAPGNSLVLFVDGLGRRVAVSYEGSASAAPLLHIKYSSAQPAPPTPTAAPTNVPTATARPTATQPPATPTSVPTASPTPSGNPQPIGQTGNWKMIFNDEFNSSSLDTNKWRTCFWWADTTCSIETNHELELYNPQDILVQNGVLQLRAQKRDMVAWNGSTYHYTSGMVMSGGRSGSVAPEFSFTYGYAEARVKVPAGKSLWPAFWMLPISYNSRPEIDIMEILGDRPDIYHMNYHYIGGDQGSSWTGPDFSAGWHVIGLDWEPDAIVWYVDGVERYRFTNKSYISHEPEYLLLNLAVGGDWPGSPDSNTPFPSTFDVDYVRVWQK